MPADDEIWQLLNERLDGDEHARPDEADRVWVSIRRESVVRILEAGASVLAATGKLLAVMEEVVREQRVRVVANAEAAPEPEAPVADQSGRGQRIDLSY